MTKYSIIPEMIAFKKITLVNENSIPVKICEPSPFVYQCPFKQPSFVFDKFAKKTTKLDKIVNVTYDELKNLGYCIYKYRASKSTKWKTRQLWIFVIDRIGSTNIHGTALLNIPNNHKVVKDIENNQIKLLGDNAGFPHQADGGPFLKLK